MNSFDNKIKNKLDGHTMPVGGDMWSKISQSKDMPQDDKSNRSIWLMSGLFLLLVSSFGYVMTSYGPADTKTVEAHRAQAILASTKATVIASTPIQKTENIAATIDNTNTTATAITTSIHKVQETNTPTLLVSNTDESVEAKTLNLSTKIMSTNLTNNFALTVAKTEPIIQKTPIEINTYISEDVFKTNETNTIESKEPTTNINDNLAIKSNIGLNVNSKINFLENNILSNTVFSIDEKVDLGQKIYHKYHKSPDCYSFGRSEVGTQFSLDAYGGPLYGMNSFANSPNSQDVDGTYLAARKDSEVEVLGFTAGLRLSVLFNEKFAIRSGFNYSQNVERFEFAMENVEVTTRTINTYIIDNGNGPMEFMDTTYVTTTGSQVVEHYNKVNYMDIPIMVGFEKEIYNNWSFNINAGAMINVKSSATGRILDINNSIMDYDNNSVNNPNIYKTSVGLSLMASVGLNYKLNDNLKILFEPQFRKILSPISEATHTLEQSQSHVSFVTGLRYTF